MGKQIIKQPNGLYAIWSTTVDDFTVVDCTPEDIIEMAIKEASDQIRKEVLDTVAQLDAGEKPYYQFTLSFEQAVKTVRYHHGENAQTLALLGIKPKKKRKASNE